MARRRMFSNTIVENDVFLDMPLSTQALYFHLSMNADDDGFVSPKRIMRMVGANDDDLKVLLAKRYVLGFDSSVVVVKHWQINNLIRKDRYNATTFKDELKTLTTNSFGAYTEIHKITTNTPELTEPVAKTVTNGKPTVNPGKVRLGKSSIGKVRHNTTSVVLGAEAPGSYGKPEINELFNYWEEIVGVKVTAQMAANRRAASNLIKKYGADTVKRMIGGVAYSHGEKYAPAVANFCQLQSKWDDLIIWGKKRNGRGSKGKIYKI